MDFLIDKMRRDGEEKTVFFDEKEDEIKKDEEEGLI